MDKHVYLAIENVGLTNAQRDTLIDALKALGPPWQSELYDFTTPIVYEYDQDGEIVSQTGGDTIQLTRYFHGNQPAIMNHWRVRPDKQAAIFEALFNENNLTVDVFRNRLANIFDIDPSTITDKVQQTRYGPLVTFARGGDRLRFLLFGGLGASWMESGDACRAYLKAHQDEWEIVALD